MSSIRKTLTAMVGLLVLLMTTPSLFAQGGVFGPGNKAICMEAVAAIRHRVATFRLGPLSIQDHRCSTLSTQA